MSNLHPSVPPQPQPTDLDQLLANLILALASRRYSSSFSTAYYWNSHALLLLSQALQPDHNPAPTSSVAGLLRRIRTHALWFQDHYRNALAAFQRATAAESVLARRRQSAADFEARRPGMPASPFAPTMAARAERLEFELREVWRSRVGPGVSLYAGRMGVGQEQHQQQGREWEVRLAGPDGRGLGLGLGLERELRGCEEQKTRRAVVVEGVDEDMLLRFWEANPGV